MLRRENGTSMDICFCLRGRRQGCKISELPAPVKQQGFLGWRVNWLLYFHQASRDAMWSWLQCCSHTLPRLLKPPSLHPLPTEPWEVGRGEQSTSKPLGWTSLFETLRCTVFLLYSPSNSTPEFVSNTNFLKQNWSFPGWRPRKVYKVSSLWKSSL